MINCSKCGTPLNVNANGLCGHCGALNVQLPPQTVAFTPPPPVQYAPVTPPPPVPTTAQQPQPTPQPPTTVVVTTPTPTPTPAAAARGVHGLTIAAFVVACVVLAALLGFWFHWGQRGAGAAELAEEIKNTEELLASVKDAKAELKKAVDEKSSAIINKVGDEGLLTRAAVTSSEGAVKLATVADGDKTRAAITADGVITRAAVVQSEINVVKAVQADGDKTRAAVDNARKRLSSAMAAAARANAANFAAAKSDLDKATADFKAASAAVTVNNGDSDGSTDN